MTAKEYLRIIRSIKHRIKKLDEEIAQEQEEYNCLQGIDYAKDKMDGGELADLSEKIPQKEKVIGKLNAQRRRLHELREEARERINAIQDYDVQTFLIDYSIIAKPLWLLPKVLHLTRSGTNKRIRKAEKCFDAIYGEWLSEIDVADMFS